MDKKLDIFGPYPPPMGGISIHIFRMESFLRKEGIPYKIYNHGSFSDSNVIATNKSPLWYVKYLFSKKAPVLHFHHFLKFHYLYFLIFGFCSKTKLIVTIHGEDMLYYNRATQWLIIWALRNTKFAELISVSSKLSIFLNQKGIHNLLLPAYVPPARLNFQRLEKVAGKDYFLYSIWEINRGIAISIYNMELAFKLLDRRRENYHMLFLVGSKQGSDMEYLFFLIDKYQVSDSLTIIFEKQLTDYLSNCKFLVRTNNEDGYGVSLQEALDLRIPAIASDVCVRPKGTILFEKGNIDDLCEKVDNIEKYWMEDEIVAPNYHTQLLEIYKKTLI